MYLFLEILGSSKYHICLFFVIPRSLELGSENTSLGVD
jgi:hypothetical protein